MNLYHVVKTRKLLEKIGFEEPLEHIITVDNIRKYWKPDKTKVILLAESHIKTEQEIFKREKDLTRFDGINGSYPRNVVDFVYCLGQDTGKIQFWKILSAAVGQFDFSKLRLKNVSFDERTKHRIEILIEMKKRGIWLVDASIFALYPKKGSNNIKNREKIMIECWEKYIGNVVVNESPKKVLFIGKEVWNALEPKLPKNISRDWIYQPQAHIVGGYHSQLKKCFNFCNS